MYTNVLELKKQEYDNIEKTAGEIASQLRDFEGMTLFAKTVSTAYLAYLVKKEEIQNTKSLIDYVDNELPETQRYFLKDRTTDLYWAQVLEISKQFSIESLMAVVLWHSSSNVGRFEGEHETPESLVKLAYGLLEPKNESVADLCSGVGTFLTYAAMKDPDNSLYGVEIHTQAKEISEIRLSIISDNYEIEQGSLFGISLEKKFDKIFCNYPWGMRSRMTSRDEEIFKILEDQVPELKNSRTADWHFIFSVINHLNEGGKAVVLTTNGTTWNAGISKQLRESLIKLGLLEAVISLPERLFSSATIATSMLILSRNNYDSIRVIDASKLATVGRRQNEISDEAITEIIEMMNKDCELSKQVSITDIADMDYIVNPSRYLETEIEVENGVPFSELIKSITRGAQIKASELDEMVSDTPTQYQYLMLSNIQDGMISDDLPYLRELDKKLEKYCIKNNSLVISKNGAPIKVAVASVEDGHQILANGNLYVVELDEDKANPYFVKAYLESEAGTIALSRITVGSQLPNIPVDSLKKMLIPNPPIEEQNRIAEKYLTKMDEIKVLKYRLQKATLDLKNIFEEEQALCYQSKNSVI